MGGVGTLFSREDSRRLVRLHGLLLAAGTLLSGGCQAPRESISGIVQRQTEALSRLPQEDQSMLVSPQRPAEVADPNRMIQPGLLPLEHAREVALVGSPDIWMARARLESALARIAEARSHYFPQIAATHTTTRTFDTPNRFSRLPQPFRPEPNIDGAALDDFIGDPSPDNLLGLLRDRLFGRSPSLDFSDHNSFSDHTSALSATWLLFNGFIRESQMMIAKYNYLASVMSLADSQRQLVQAVDTAYYQAQLGHERLRIALADEEFSERQLQDARRRFEANKITKADVLNFEVRVRAAQANVVIARGLREVARVALAELMGLRGTQLSADVKLAELQEESAEELTPPEVEAWSALALEARPDLAQARQLLKAGEEGILLAQGRFSPAVTMGGSWGFERASNMAYSKDDRSSAAGIEVRWDLYTGGRRSAMLRRARADWWEANSYVAKITLAVEAEVQQAVIGVINAQEEVQLQKRNLESAQENRRVVESQYAAGKAPVTRLNQAQGDLVSVEADLATSRIRLRQAWTDLRAAAGSKDHINGPNSKSPGD